MNLGQKLLKHRSPRGRLAAVAAAIALVIAACGQAASPASVPAASGAVAPSGALTSPAPSVAPSPVVADLATVSLPDPARIVVTTAFGEVPVNQVIVVLADGKGPADAEALAAGLGGRVVGRLDFVNAYQVETSGSTEADLTAALATVRATAGVLLAAPNQTVKPVEDSNEIWGTRISPMTDPLYGGGNGDGYELIGVPAAWDYIRGSGMDLDLVQVGVVDSGLWNGANEFDSGAHVTFVEPSANLPAPEQQTNADGSQSDDPSGGHGSGVNVLIGADEDDGGPVGVASVLGDKLTISNTNLWAAQYGTGFTPAAPDPDDPTIVTYPGNGKTYQFGDLVAIMSQVDAGSTIINLSWGPSDYTKTDPNVPKIYRDFFEKMSKERPDVIFVAAAGNDGVSMNGAKYFPAGFNLPNIMTVGNVNNDSTVTDSSNTAGSDFEVSIFAPGHQAVRGYNPDTKAVKNLYGGTSMATPQVVATAALLRSLNKNLTAAQLKDIITRTAVVKDGTLILAVDQAVKAVIDLNCDEQGIPRMDEETLLGRGAVDAVAVPVAGSPGVFTIRGIVKATGDKGVDLDVTVSAGEVTSGDEPAHLEAAGDATWTITLDPPDEGVIVVRRTDNRAGSRIAIETIDVNGAWAGSFTFVSSELSPEVKAQAEAMAEEQGCDLAMLEELKGKTLPMTLDLSVDPNSTGTSTYWIDVSSIKNAEGEPMTSEPQTAAVTYKGNRLTFQFEGEGGAMSGVVSRSGDILTIKGTLTITGEGYSAKGAWTVSKARA